MSKINLIVEDGSCIEGANTIGTVKGGRSYWSNRIGGEQWDLSVEGENFCDDSICKALITAIDYLNTLDLGPNYCPTSCVPTPINCDCNGRPAIKLLEEAQYIAANAILRGWNPFAVSTQTARLVNSISSPDEGSVTFSRPTPLEPCFPLKGAQIGAEAIRRIRHILRPLMGHAPQGRMFLT